MEVIVTILSKLVYFTYLRGVNSLINIGVLRFTFSITFPTDNGTGIQLNWYVCATVDASEIWLSPVDIVSLEVNHHFKNGGSFWKMINPY